MKKFSIGAYPPLVFLEHGRVYRLPVRYKVQEQHFRVVHYRKRCTEIFAAMINSPYFKKLGPQLGGTH